MVWLVFSIIVAFTIVTVIVLIMIIWLLRFINIFSEGDDVTEDWSGPRTMQSCVVWSQRRRANFMLGLSAKLLQPKL